MAAVSNLKNMTLVLGLTCLLCSAVLGGAYALTKKPIDAAAVAKTNKAVGAVLPAFDETSYESVEVERPTTTTRPSRAVKPSATPSSPPSSASAARCP